jgi:hypothetical protein
MSECQKEMMAAGKAYPRSCPACGLGPCSKGYDSKWTLRNQVGKGPVLSPAMAKEFPPPVSPVIDADPPYDPVKENAEGNPSFDDQPDEAEDAAREFNVGQEVSFGVLKIGDIYYSRGKVQSARWDEVEGWVYNVEMLCRAPTVDGNDISGGERVFRQALLYPLEGRDPHPVEVQPFNLDVANNRFNQILSSLGEIRSRWHALGTEKSYGLKILEETCKEVADLQQRVHLFTGCSVSVGSVSMSAPNPEMLREMSHPHDEAWMKVAQESNIAIDQYLRKLKPDLPEHYGMPVDGVRMVVEHLTAQNDEMVKARDDLFREEAVARVFPVMLQATIKVVNNPITQQSTATFQYMMAAELSWQAVNALAKVRDTSDHGRKFTNNGAAPTNKDPSEKKEDEKKVLLQ